MVLTVLSVRLIATGEAIRAPLCMTIGFLVHMILVGRLVAVVLSLLAPLAPLAPLGIVLVGVLVGTATVGTGLIVDLRFVC